MSQQNVISKIISRHPGKKLVIFGAANGGLYVFYHALECGVEAEYFVDNNKAGTFFCRKEVRYPCDLMYEDPDKLLIIVGINQSDAVKSVVEQLEGMGFVCGENIELPEFGELYAPADYLDPLLSYSRMNDLPGFKVTRSTGKNPLKIVCLGGSTSDWSFGGYKCWGEFYWNMLNEAGVNADFYNGAIAGYHSSLELFKLIRDVIPLKPDCLLLLNGVNDGNQSPLPRHPMHHSYTGKTFECFINKERTSELQINGEVNGVLFGIEDDSSAFEVYQRNMRMMKVLCDEFKILFFPVLQPTKTFQKSVIPDMSLEKFYSEAHEKLPPFITNGINWLENEENVYFDYIHYSEIGNCKIAKKFFDLTVHSLKELKK